MKKFRVMMVVLTALGHVAAFAQTGVETESQGSSVKVTMRTGAAYSAREIFIDRLLQRMTLEEKTGQLRLISVPAGAHPDKTQLLADIRAGRVGGIFNTVNPPAIRMLQEAALASRLKIPMFFSFDIIHGHRTIFPVGLGMASTWNLEAVTLMGRTAAREASADGVSVTFSPVVDISRDPRWGRNSEGFGEDTYLTSQMGATLVKAYQGDDLRLPGTLLSVPKHFAAYGAVEGGRDYNTVDMSLQRLYQDYLSPYKAAVDAGAGGVMMSLSSLNGVPATGNPWLIRDVLRKQWGFKGIVMSDHGAVEQLMEHGVVGDEQDAAKVAMTAGLEMSMADAAYDKDLVTLVKKGQVSQSTLDQAVRDVLRVKYDLGLFQDAYRHLGPPQNDPPDTHAESRLNREAARQVAQESLVLLKNQNGILPLKKDGVIAVVGPLARSQGDMMGNWPAAGRQQQAISVYQGMAHVVGDQATLLYARGANVTDDLAIVKYLNLYSPNVQIDTRSADQLIDEAVEVARRADVVVAVVGESQGMAHEAASRTDIRIPPSQRRLLEALKATGVPLVLVLMNGRPLALVWEHDQADAILETWFAGTEGGHAIADVLFGDANPSGKLPMTFPRVVGQVPLYYNFLNTGRPFDSDPSNKYSSRYMDVKNGPLFPFGYGLSYTTFKVSPVALTQATMVRGGQLQASVTVTNTGNRAGATVIQLYIQDPVASVSRPLKELKQFQKVILQKGESRQISFTLDEGDLSFYNAALQYGAESGKFNVYIGLDSQDVQASSFTLL
jgi:beta-glucosidase